MATKAPKTRCDGTMTESGYLAWIRSALRSKSLRWLPRTTAIVKARRPYKGPNKRAKWEHHCAMCREWFMAKDIVVDHYPKAAGSILSVDDISSFCENLYCDSTNLRVLCKPCHDVHTLAESSGMTLEEAGIEKRAITQLKDKKGTLALLSSKGYSGKEVSNEEKRRELLVKIFKGETDDY